MKTIQLYSLLLLMGLLTFTACDDDDDMDFDFSFEYDFAQSQHGWTGDFADYPVGEEDFYELSFAYENLPAPLDTTQKALEIIGSNRSDDLFMFTKKKLTGLSANTEYTVQFDLQLASQYPENSVGIGGSPGAANYLKVGASTVEPQKVATDDFYQLNVDKGNQSQGGADAVVVGTLGIPGDDFVYTLIERNNDEQSLQATTNADGELWVFIGVDSGFEGLTRYYITEADITLTVAQ